MTTPNAPGAQPPARPGQDDLGHAEPGRAHPRQADPRYADPRRTGSGEGDAYDAGEEQAERATAKAELAIVLFPAKLTSEIDVPGDQAQPLIDAAGRMSQLALTAILVIGTLFGAGAAHLSPLMTMVIVLAELVTAAGAGHVHRTWRRR